MAALSSVRTPYSIANRQQTRVPVGNSFSQHPKPRGQEPLYATPIQPQPEASHLQMVKKFQSEEVSKNQNNEPNPWVVSPEGQAQIDSILSQLVPLEGHHAEVLNKAIATAHKQLNTMIEKLENKDANTVERLHAFFGNDATPEGIMAGLKLIKARITNIKKQKTFYYDPTDMIGAIAYTLIPPSASISWDPMIVVRAPFFKNLSSRNRQANVLIHEAAHSILNVTDINMSKDQVAYGVQAALTLGHKVPHHAINNADNWALFVNSFGFDGFVDEVISYKNYQSGS